MTGDDAAYDVVVTCRLPAPVEERLAQLFNVRLCDGETGNMTPQALVEAAHGARVVLSTITDRLDDSLIARLPDSVRLIAQFGNGVDNIDLAAAHARGIVVTNTPSVMTEDTADMAMALIMALPRRLVEGATLLQGGKAWAGWSPTSMLGRRLEGKSLGIVGLGRIGAAVARRARAFGLNIHYWGRAKRPDALEAELGAQFWPDIDAMLAEMDIVSLHVPLNDQTRGMLSHDRLKAMKQDACLVNVSRPELLDEQALVDLIRSGHLSGAGLDVFSHKDGVDPDLLELARAHRVILTPHMASSTLEARLEMGETVIVNIRFFLDGHQPPQRVLPF